ncbi:MAG: hypothetical protein Q8N56_02755 [bacterium]|nr:hypothetical protein [bacterium]
MNLIDLIPWILGMTSIAIIIDVRMTARQSLKKTFGDRGEMYFQFYGGGLQKTMLAIVLAVTSIVWIILA